MLPSSFTVRGQVYTAEVTSTDGEDAGGLATAEISVVNTPPEATSGRFEPPDPASRDDIRVIVKVTDPDDDIVELFYEWTLNGVPTGFNEDTIPSSSTKSGQTWAVVVTYHDQIDMGEPMEGEVTVR